MLDARKDRSAEILQGVAAMASNGEWLVENDEATVHVRGNRIEVSLGESDDGETVQVYELVLRRTETRA